MKKKPSTPPSGKTSVKTSAKASAKTEKNQPAPETRGVAFHFNDPEASSVSIAGSFNEWHPSATPMVPLGQGRWSKTLELGPGTYEYLFVVDGRWVPDPGSAVTVTNPFGGINCCVSVR